MSIEINVKGQLWDVESVDGNIVTLVNGNEIEVNDQTLKAVEGQIKGKSHKPALGNLFSK